MLLHWIFEYKKRIESSTIFCGVIAKYVGNEWMSIQSAFLTHVITILRHTYDMNVMKCRKNVSFSRKRNDMGWSNHRFYYSSIVTYSSIPIVLYITKTAFGDIQVQVSSLLCQT